MPSESSRTEHFAAAVETRERHENRAVVGRVQHVVQVAAVQRALQRRRLRALRVVEVLLVVGRRHRILR